VHEPGDAGVPGSPGEDRRALDGHPVLHFSGRTHRVDCRDDRVGALGHRAGEGLVGKVADVLGDAVERRRAACTSHDGAHLRRPLDERPAHRGAHQSVRTGHHGNGGGIGHIAHTASDHTTAPAARRIPTSGRL
jgi:hypothetical protein